MASPLETLLLIALGRLFIYLWMEFPLPKAFDNGRFGKLHKCSLCSGQHIYFILFWIYGVDYLEMLGLPHIFIVGNFVSAGITTFLMHLLEIGFREKFITVTIE